LNFIHLKEVDPRRPGIPPQKRISNYKDWHRQRHKTESGGDGL